MATSDVASRSAEVAASEEAPESPSNLFEQLPDELIEHVLAFTASAKTLGRLAQTCRRLSRIVEGQSCWRSLMQATQLQYQELLSSRDMELFQSLLTPREQCRRLIHPVHTLKSRNIWQEVPSEDEDADDMMVSRPISSATLAFRGTFVPSTSRLFSEAVINEDSPPIRSVIVSIAQLAVVVVDVETGATLGAYDSTTVGIPHEWRPHRLEVMFPLVVVGHEDGHVDVINIERRQYVGCICEPQGSNVYMVMWGRDRDTAQVKQGIADVLYAYMLHGGQMIRKQRIVVYDNVELISSETVWADPLREHQHFGVFYMAEDTSRLVWIGITGGRVAVVNHHTGQLLRINLCHVDTTSRLISLGNNMITLSFDGTIKLWKITPSGEMKLKKTVRVKLAQAEEDAVLCGLYRFGTVVMTAVIGQNFRTSHYALLDCQTLDQLALLPHPGGRDRFNSGGNNSSLFFDGEVAVASSDYRGLYQIPDSGNTLYAFKAAVM